MGKGYLNSEEKAIVMTLGAFIDYLERLDGKLAALTKPPKAAIKYTRTALTFTKKILDHYCKNLDRTELVKLLGDPKKLDKFGKRIIKGELDRMEVVVKYKAEAVRDYEAMKQMESVTPIETKDLMDIITFATISCELCEPGPGDADRCPFRRLFIKYDAEPRNADADPAAGECPYKAVHRGAFT